MTEKKPGAMLLFIEACLTPVIKTMHASASRSMAPRKELDPRIREDDKSEALIFIIENFVLSIGYLIQLFHGYPAAPCFHATQN